MLITSAEKLADRAEKPASASRSGSWCTHEKKHLIGQLKQCLGAQGEEHVARHCVAKGYRVLARNWRAAHGEIDLIVQDGRTVVAVEVKTRSGVGLGSPFHAITPRKLQRLQSLLFQWMQVNGYAHYRARVDAAAVLMRPGQKIALEYLKAATHG
ncbi:YraN family protein [Canibacter zhoujuaniae]|uniref:YraN family protein n=1 Tax=Canibacter zhoujuaniae TaxID=2708343 RepID=UPI00141F8377|nr:YraN family protein [Canibacter zhoujuaniae]